MEVAPFFVDFHHFLSIFTIFIDLHDLRTFVAIYILSRFTHFFRNFFFAKIAFSATSHVFCMYGSKGPSLLDVTSVYPPHTVFCALCFVHKPRTGNQTALGNFKLKNKTKVSCTCHIYGGFSSSQPSASSSQFD